MPEWTGTCSGASRNACRSVHKLTMMWYASFSVEGGGGHSRNACSWAMRHCKARFFRRFFAPEQPTKRGKSWADNPHDADCDDQREGMRSVGCPPFGVASQAGQKWAFQAKNLVKSFLPIFGNYFWSRSFLSRRTWDPAARVASICLARLVRVASVS